MLLTFLIDPPVLLLLGYLFALAIPFSSRRPIRKTRAFCVGLLVLTIFNIGVAISYWRYPDWMWMYYLSPSQASVGVRAAQLAFGLAAYYLLYMVGFVWGARLHARRGRAAWIGVALLGAASVLIILPVFSRYYHVGTTIDFIEDTAIPLPQSSLALIYNIAVPVMVVVGVIGFWCARREKE